MSSVLIARTLRPCAWSRTPHRPAFKPLTLVLRAPLNLVDDSPTSTTSTPARSRPASSLCCSMCCSPRVAAWFPGPIPSAVRNARSALPKSPLACGQDQAAEVAVSVSVARVLPDRCTVLAHRAVDVLAHSISSEQVTEVVVGVYKFRVELYRFTVLERRAIKVFVDNFEAMCEVEARPRVLRVGLDGLLRVVKLQAMSYKQTLCVACVFIPYKERAKPGSGARQYGHTSFTPRSLYSLMQPRQMPP
jgi:hypothetical protein